MLEACGWRWEPHSAKDGPDGFASKIVLKANICCGKCQHVVRRTVAIEIKSGKAKLREGQAKWLDDWPGEKAVLRSVEEVKEL